MVNLRKTMSLKDMWSSACGVMASNQKVYEFTSRPSKASFGPAVGSLLLHAAVTAGATYVASAAWSATAAGINKMLEKKENKNEQQEGGAK